MTHIPLSVVLTKSIRFFGALAFLCFLSIGCGAPKIVKQKITLGIPDEIGSEPQTGNKLKSDSWSYVLDDHEYINLPIKDIALPDSIAIDSLLDNGTNDLSLNLLASVGEVQNSPVAKKIVENYINSANKEPNGHCLEVSKNRFERAYRQVHGHSVYKDLPDYMGTDVYSPRQVYNLLYVSASDTKKGWRSLPELYRGKGNAGAVAYAGMGTLVNTAGVWAGELQPGALMQVWRYEKDYEKVVKGADVKKLDPYGHSFVFIGYVRNEKNEIEGLKIADQGFQSYRPLVPRDYEVWWGVNLGI